MGSRLALHNIFKSICENAYFQPPKSTDIKYPCIIYKLNKIDTKFADNKPYLLGKMYSVTVITPDPDDPIIDLVGALPLCVFDRPYTSDNLNHYIYNLYY